MNGVAPTHKDSKDFLLVINSKHSPASKSADRIRDHLMKHNAKDPFTRVVPIGSDRNWFTRTSMLENLRLHLDHQFNSARSETVNREEEFKIGVLIDKFCFDKLREIIQMIKEYTKDHKVTKISIATDTNLGQVLITDRIENLKDLSLDKLKILGFIKILIKHAGQITVPLLEELKAFAIKKGSPIEDFDVLLKTFLANYTPCIYKPSTKPKWLSPWADQFFPFIDRFFGIKTTA